jgi:hypothetical protein
MSRKTQFGNAVLSVREISFFNWIHPGDLQKEIKGQQKEVKELSTKVIIRMRSTVLDSESNLGERRTPTLQSVFLFSSMCCL